MGESKPKKKNLFKMHVDPPDKSFKFVGENHQIMLKTDIALLNLDDVARNLLTIKKLQPYNFYNGIIEDFLALHPLLAMNMEVDEYIKYFKTRKNTPYNLPLGETINLAFVGFAYLYHYVSSAFGSFDLFQMHLDINNQYVTKLTQLTGDNYSKKIKCFQKNSKLHHGKQSCTDPIRSELQDAFIQEYINDTCKLADRLVAALVDHYYNHFTQNLPSLYRYFDIIGQNEGVWQFYYDKIIMFYAKYNTNNYLKNFKDYTYADHHKTYVIIKEKLNLPYDDSEYQDQANEQKQATLVTPDQIQELSPVAIVYEEEQPICDNKIKYEKEEQSVINTEEKEKETICQHKTNEDEKQLAANTNTTENQTSTSIQTEITKYLSLYAPDDIQDPCEICPIQYDQIFEISHRYSEKFNHQVYVELGGLTTKYSLLGDYTYGVYVDGDFSMGSGHTKFIKDAKIHIQYEKKFYGRAFIVAHAGVINIYQEKRTEPVIMDKKRFIINTEPKARVRYLKYKDREKASNANVLFQNGIWTLGMKLAIVENAIYNPLAVDILDIFNKVDHALGFGSLRPLN